MQIPARDQLEGLRMTPANPRRPNVPPGRRFAQPERFNADANSER